MFLLLRSGPNERRNSSERSTNQRNKHYEELLIYMRDEPFDILTLNETRLDSTFLDCEVQIPGYDIVRSDRNRYGGGVAIYI